MKLISGGQSGVDRAVLAVALARGVAYGGWCPKGGWAEDFSHPPGLLANYPKLHETPLADPAQRTEWNVRDADACMILADANGLAASRGTMLGRELVERRGKPWIVVNIDEPHALGEAGAWLSGQCDTFGPNFSLAIGGPRESEVPGIHKRAADFLAALLEGFPP